MAAKGKKGKANLVTTVQELPVSRSPSGESSSSSWDKSPPIMNSIRLKPRKQLLGRSELGGLSSRSSSSCSGQEDRYRLHGSDGFEVELLSSEPEDYDESGHLFHMDIMKSSLSDISYSSTQRLSSGRPKARNQNISFSRERVREIERHNQILLQRIMSSKPTLRTKPVVQPVVVPTTNNSRITSAAVNRKKKQRQIEIDNQILRKKLEKIERSRRNVW
ncbi:protein hemingway-like [Uranotaenia lowii]|uniref:protein hemingway-like n=1 Tax=Uranotaenia lowii TaxID=190385 RepID=UPI00247A769C|nr:protein hemingway-like [Uranotaenia lowii]